MSVLPILHWPDARLSTPCAPVDDPAALAGLVADMFETMYAAPGRGLAAPQVGVMLRLFVMDAGWKTGTKTPLVCINPEVEPLDGTDTITEGCLSMPGIEVSVIRPARIRLHWTDLAGSRQTADLDGAEARIAQHETDHLDGRMHFTRVPDETRVAILAQWDSMGETRT